MRAGFDRWKLNAGRSAAGALACNPISRRRVPPHPLDWFNLGDVPRAAEGIKRREQIRLASVKDGDAGDEPRRQQSQTPITLALPGAAVCLENSEKAQEQSACLGRRI